MSNHLKIVARGAAALAVAASMRIAAADETFEQAVRGSDFIMDMRLRYEGVEQTGFSEDAEALTARLRAGLQTAPWHKTSFLAEGVWVGDPVDDYNSTTNGETQYPVVADPADFTAVNRFEIINKSLEHTTITAGRQRIALDDQRFVGNVGWRQNEQTLDALRAQLAGPNVKADVTYASQVNRVFGPDSPQGRWHGDVVLANVSKAWTAASLTVFNYYLDINEAPTQSSDTFGARLAGAKPLGKLRATYTLSYATQTDVAKKTAHYTDGYYLLEGGLDIKKITVGLGYEVLESDGKVAFATPLGHPARVPGLGRQVPDDPDAGHRRHVSEARLLARHARRVQELERARLELVGPTLEASAIAAVHAFDTFASTTSPCQRPCGESGPNTRFTWLAYVTSAFTFGPASCARSASSVCSFCRQPTLPTKR